MEKYKSNLKHFIRTTSLVAVASLSFGSSTQKANKPIKNLVHDYTCIDAQVTLSEEKEYNNTLLRDWQMEVQYDRYYRLDPSNDTYLQSIEEKIALNTIRLSKNTANAQSLCTDEGIESITISSNKASKNKK